MDTKLPLTALFPRVLFPSPEAALAATPFFIDEQGVGCWLSTADQRLLQKGKVIWSGRYALHIPSVDREDKLLTESQLEKFRRQALDLGLIRETQATGYWTLSESGIIQQEQVLICYSEVPIPPDNLRRLARHILVSARQDAVAMEISGKVEVTRR